MGKNHSLPLSGSSLSEIPGNDRRGDRKPGLGQEDSMWPPPCLNMGGVSFQVLFRELRLLAKAAGQTQTERSKEAFASLSKGKVRIAAPKGFERFPLVQSRLRHRPSYLKDRARL